MIFPQEADGVASATWLDWWAPNDMRRSYQSGDKATRVVALDSYPVYVREGAILPLHDTNKEDPEETELVNMDRYTFTWFHPQASATKASPAHYEMRESMMTGTGMTVKAWFPTSDSITAEISSHPGAVAFDLIGVERPGDVNMEVFHTAGCRHSYEVTSKRARVQCKNMIGGVRIQWTGIQLSSQK